MTKVNIKKAQMHLHRIRELMSKVSSPYQGMSKQEIIEKIRKTRQKLWEAKFASYSR